MIIVAMSRCRRVMSENHLNEKKSKSKIATYTAITLLAGCVGFLAIYVTFAPHDNEEPRIAQQIAQQTAANRLKKLDCPRRLWHIPH